MCECFHPSGNMPAVNDMLNSLVIEGVMEWAVDLSIRAEIPSGPLDFVVSRDCSIFKTSASVHNSSAGHSPLNWACIAGWSNGGIAVLKHCLKNSLNMLALSMSFLAQAPLCVKTGIVLLVFCRCFIVFQKSF